VKDRGEAEAEVAALGLPGLTSRVEIHIDLQSHYDICQAFQPAQWVRILYCVDW